ncbi:Trm112 family protein [Candidatus Calescamantes bacterium]|nr:Trm112 family protein [Candidatus Calescamantes bacterium]RLE67816.1 MAG: Trm112 family protein [Thermoprotei archaeon]
MDEKLLEILACPKCKGDLILEDDKLICKKCKKYYPIKDGIPILLIEEAKDYEEEN